VAAAVSIWLVGCAAEPPRPAEDPFDAALKAAKERGVLAVAEFYADW
jgi:hypothetical protein